MSAVVTVGGKRRTRRGTELAMLFFAVVLGAFVTVAAQAAQDRPISWNSLNFLVVLPVLLGGAHLAIRRLAPYADPLLLPLVAVLNGLGIGMIHRLDLSKYPTALPAHYLPFLVGDAGLQLMWSLVGLVFFVVVLAVIRDHRTLARYSYTFGFIGLVLLALPAMLPARFSVAGGAKIWIRLGGFSIQPGEFAKVALMIFFASYLVAKRDVLSLASKRIAGIDLPRGRDLGPVLVAWGFSLLLLIFERDLGSSLLFFGIFVVMLYIATERTSWLIIGVVLFLGGATLAWSMFAHVQERVTIWLHPFADANNQGYQIVQALFGMATGGLFGTGPGSGRPEIVPLASSDFIVSTIGEELGLFGLTAVLVVYALIAERGLRTSLAVRDSFGKLLAAGMAFSLGLQVFVIVGGATKLLPLTGLTTPFLSQGGSSLVANYMLIAILVRISDAARRPPTPGRQGAPAQDAPTQAVRL